MTAQMMNTRFTIEKIITPMKNPSNPGGYGLKSSNGLGFKPWAITPSGYAASVSSGSG
jgi:hypothetical protein